MINIRLEDAKHPMAVVVSYDAVDKKTYEECLNDASGKKEVE